MPCAYCKCESKISCWEAREIIVDLESPMGIWGAGMRLVSSLCVVTAVTLCAMPARAHELQMRGHAPSYATAELGGSDVTPVNRGQPLAIACESIGAPGSDVRVVMSVDTVKGEEPTGFEAVLLTGQTVQGNAVHVRVPDMPDLVNHTVTLKVYVTGPSGTTACNAGHLRIG